MSKSRFLVVDVSGKVLNYDYALCQAMTDEACGEVEVVLAAHLHDKDKYHGRRLRLLSLIPRSQQTSSGKLKRIVKAAEGFINYTFVLLYIIVKHPSVVHFQWLPYLEFSSVEIPYIKLIRFFKSHIKLIYTIHNVYPHSMIQVDRRPPYRQRFMRMMPLIDHFVVHTGSAATEVKNAFDIARSRISIVSHGIFKPDYKLKNNHDCRNEKKTIIFYGANRRNKGADILLDAVHLLPEEHKNHVRILMLGRTPNDYLNELKSKCSGIDVTLDPRFIPDEELYEMIDASDYIALPYREITQSGVLLLALYFKKPLLISNLPPFLETLRGFSKDMFFEAGNPNSMSDLIVRHLEGKIDVEKELNLIMNLNSDYSWENSAIKTLNIYKKVII